MCYDMNGKPYKESKTKGSVISQWGKDFENIKKRVLGHKTMYLGSLLVSTVWLGLDHSFGIGKKPLIFETMVFAFSFGGEVDVERYSSREDAIEGHKKFIEKYKNPFTYAAAVYPIVKTNILTKLGEMWEDTKKYLKRHRV